MKESLDIIVVGDNNLDITNKLNEDVLSPAFIKGNAPTAKPGGTGLNVAVALKNFELNVGYITSFGNDIVGECIKSYITGKGIDVKNSKKIEKNTGIIVSVMKNDNSNIVLALTNNSAFYYLKDSDIEEEYIKTAKGVFISGAIIYEETTFTAIQKIIEIAKKNNVKVFFDPNIRIFNKSLFASTRQHFVEILEKCDVFMPNEMELKMIFDRDDIDFAKTYCDSKETTLWIKKGEKGSEYYSKGESIEFPIYATQAIDTLGAGDCYDGALIFGYSKFNEVKDMGRFASIAAGISVSRRGSSGSYPSLDEITEIFLVNYKD